MANGKIIYKEKPDIFAKYYHPQSEDFLKYNSTIQIKSTGKQPIILKLKFAGMYPSFAPMPPETHTIKAENLIDLYLKLNRWFSKYGYAIK